jgi:VCBS repeat-containing protein
VLGVAAPGSYAGAYGTLALSANGSYTYTLDNAADAVQSLGRTAVVKDSFGYTATDSIAGTPSLLDVSITGVNDAPIVAKPLADQDFTFNKPFSWQMPVDSFTDVDRGDALDYVASLADGSPLPEWLTFDPAAGTFSGWTPKQVAEIDVCVTASDKVAATGSTEGSLSVSDVFRFTVSHGNEGVGNDQDAAPAGHGYNQNDGPFTSPGNPGSRNTPFASDPGLTVAPAAMPTIAATTSAVSTATTIQDMALGTPVHYLDSEQLDAYLREFDEPVCSSNNVDMAARWQLVSRALAYDLANLGNDQARFQRLGADTGGFGHDIIGTLGSSHAFGMETTLAAGNSGTDLKGFKGLQEGLRHI